MAFLKELKDKRIKLVQEFLLDEELVKLILNKSVVVIPETNLMYSKVFPYPWIDKTIQDEKVFLCFGFRADKSPSSKGVTKNVTMEIIIFMHKALMRLPNESGLRSDAIAERIDELLNGDETYGVTDVEFISMSDISNIPDNFYGCSLRYSVKDINKLCSKE